MTASSDFSINDDVKGRPTNAINGGDIPWLSVYDMENADFNIKF